MIIGFITIAIITLLFFGNILLNHMNNQENNQKTLTLIKTNKYFKYMYFTIIAIKLGLQLLYISLIQQLSNNTRKLPNNNYELSCVIGGKLYKYIISPIRGPSDIIMISNNTNDITSEILPYINGVKSLKCITPKLLGYNHLNIDTDDGTTTYTENKPLADFNQ